MAGYIKRSYYATVTKNSSSESTYTPANGEIVIIRKVVTHPDLSGYTRIKIVWDDGGASEQILMMSYDDAEQLLIDTAVTGDGTKTLKIKLINDFSEDTELGGFWDGEIV